MERKVEQVQFPKLKVPKPKRVAAYARVSSGKDAMLHSLSAQVSYYSSLIQSHNGWEYAGVYTDEALTGTKDNRENFQRLLADCRSGKVDMVITKSISRFARNTVTLLETVRELKGYGIDVYFEEQNIHSISSEGELMLTILASYAQEESRSASENQKWRIKHNFENGMPWNATLFGYRYENGEYVIVPEEAEIIQKIYKMYLSGKGAVAIMNYLNKSDVATRKGNQWCKNGVMKLLKNYTYTGNLVLQRTYRKDHLTKELRINNGELAQYSVINSHQPIVTMEQYQAVQDEIKRREKQYARCKRRSTYPLTGLIRCENCGKNYRRKTTPQGIAWVCSTYNTQGKAACDAGYIPEDILLAALGELDKIDFVTACKNNALEITFKDGTKCVKQLERE